MTIGGLRAAHSVSRMYDLVLFDLDGTLTDPLEGISRSFNFALAQHGYEPVEPLDLAPHIGPPLDIIFEEITGSTDRGHIEVLVAKYRERYSEVGFSENRLYPGVAEAIDNLHASGIHLAVCTSKRTDFADRILAMFGLAEVFDFINGGDIGTEKWQQIASLRSEGRISDRSLMVGDRSVDLVAAHRNGLSSAAVLWGYGSLAELEAENPAHLFRSPAEWELLAARRGLN